MVFGLVLTLAVAGVHYYLWRRLVRGTTRPGRARRALTWSLVGLGVLVPVTLVASRSGFAHWLAWPGFLWLALMFYLVVFLALLEIPRGVAVVLLRRKTPVVQALTVPPAVQEVDPAEPDLWSRRLFLGRATAAVAGVSALATVGYGISTALGAPVVEPVRIALARLDPRLSGLRFAVVSDIHLGPLTGRRHTERIVRMINELDADVAIVGDLVDGTVAELGPLAEPLKDLQSRYGSYFVTGNHEYYTANGPGEWMAELERLDVRPLRNERVEIVHRGAVLDLAGVDDVTGRPDFERALGGRDRSRASVLLAHQPVQVAKAAGYGVDLQLSGHTHGGQMVPFNLIVPMQQPVVSGLATIDGVRVYVTRGAGFWGPPVRVGAPPEITLAELTHEGGL
ncbi:metallophosphoesterase [Nonomuraea africana]|uniref:MPP superfamily phosphohydrolase n=1 Tax=Nonomuraea africana TaxID=46171 RepID=A0ABR9KQA0_9ACTN|nr:metallophosphoesterase [Nonomuraea africana]MBE1564205.1 putative MPP superfamily phosphohydrolase [Nonomuraea africana]